MFIIVRHGNTFESDTTPRRIGARTDLPLTAEGVLQAKALGAYFAAQGWVFGRVLSSTLLRARQTAEAILADQPGANTVEEAEFLKEIDHGPDEDQPEAAVVERIGASALNMWEMRAKVPPGWIVEPEKRIAAWQDIFAAPPTNEPTLLVTSNGAARFALLADPALNNAAAGLTSLKLPTGGYGVITRRSEDKLHLDAWAMRP